ncbi:MAG TPA: rod shape-determining protein MreC [Terriglobales bacterium]|nr:rod shape-determining protein MreC [Terriglobales bacterium]
MESVFGRYRNLSILVGVLFLQVLGLAMQIKRNVENEPTRLIRVWTVSAVTPLEKAIVWMQNGTSGIWHNYFYLRGVRQENRDLKAEVERLRLEQVRLNEDASQARRLQVLLGFKEQFISKTLAAQVIGSSGSEQSRSIYIDKGWRDGVRPDMAVITADGVVGKVLQVYGQKPLETSTAQVLLINDQSSGVGAILEKSRLQGILRGSPSGGVVLEKVMADEEVQPGDRVLTSGGDQIFPKGLPVGTVSSAAPGKELFLNIRVKPAANLSRLEEVLVITKLEEKTPDVAETGSARAIDILAQRLPSVPDKPAEAPNKPAAAGPAIGKPEANKPNEAVATGTPAKPVEKPSVAPTTAKPAGTPLVKPASELKTPPPTVRVSTPAGETSAPTTSKPDAKPQARPPISPDASQPPAEDKPH